MKQEAEIKRRAKISKKRASDQRLAHSKQTFSEERTHLNSVINFLVGDVAGFNFIAANEVYDSDKVEMTITCSVDATRGFTSTIKSLESWHENIRPIERKTR